MDSQTNSGQNRRADLPAEVLTKVGRQILISEYLRKYNSYRTMIQQNQFVAGERLGQPVIPGLQKMVGYLFDYKYKLAFDPSYLFATEMREKILQPELSKYIPKYKF